MTKQKKITEFFNSTPKSGSKSSHDSNKIIEPSSDQDSGSSTIILDLGREDSDNQMKPKIFTLDDAEDSARSDKEQEDDKSDTFKKRTSDGVTKSNGMFKRTSTKVGRQQNLNKSRDSTTRLRVNKRPSPSTPKIQDGIIGMKVRSPNG